MTSLLVYRCGAIGDTLTLTPFLHSLRGQYDRMALVGNAERLALIDGRLYDEVLSWDLHQRRAAELASGFDLSIAFAAAPIESFSRHLPVLPPGGMNIYEWMRCVAMELGGEDSAYHPPPSGGEGLIIHPGAGSTRKNAPMEFFLEEAAKEAGTLFLLGPAEEETMEKRIRGAGFPVARPATLAAMKDLIRTRARFLGNDSGPAHLAALNGLATRVRFTVSDPAIWAPPGAQVVRRAIFSATVHLDPIS